LRCRHACLRHTHQHADIVQGLGEALEKRLLKPGAETHQILEVYIGMIRALRRLDPSGLTLDAVSERVRAYLKLRPDTVKQIVTTLTDPDSSDLLEPVGGGGAAEVVQEAVADGDMAPDPDESRGDEAAKKEEEEGSVPLAHYHEEDVALGRHAQVGAGACHRRRSLLGRRGGAARAGRPRDPRADLRLEGNVRQRVPQDAL